MSREVTGKSQTDPFQTLRFVQSLPKRERQPLANKFRNAEAEGKFVLLFWRSIV